MVPISVPMAVTEVYWMPGAEVTEVTSLARVEFRDEVAV